MATEFGLFIREGASIMDNDYGNAIIHYLENKGIGWMGWVFDPEWGPPLLKSWETYELTGAGEFFKQAIQGKIQSSDIK